MSFDIEGDVGGGDEAWICGASLVVHEKTEHDNGMTNQVIVYRVNGVERDEETKNEKNVGPWEKENVEDLGDGVVCVHNVMFGMAEPGHGLWANDQNNKRPYFCKGFVENCFSDFIIEGSFCGFYAVKNA